MTPTCLRAGIDPGVEYARLRLLGVAQVTRVSLVDDLQAGIGVDEVGHPREDVGDELRLLHVGLP